MAILLKGGGIAPMPCSRHWERALVFMCLNKIICMHGTEICILCQFLNLLWRTEGRFKYHKGTGSYSLQFPETTLGLLDL